MAIKRATKAAPATARAEAWAIFDEVVRDAAPSGEHSNPWVRRADQQLSYEPDFTTLERLLAVPLYLATRFPMKQFVRSGVPALALDVWLSFELRRAGFNVDAVWPRPARPRILPAPVAALLEPLSGQGRTFLQGLLKQQDSANILGKNYVKQVDVVMSDWITGPEVLISTKRMDSSYGKNAANRIEEAYGDAKNLRLRHPLAAMGFLLCLRSDILTLAPTKARWLIDLLAKLGREDDAYHATCLILIEYADATRDAGTPTDPPEQAERLEDSEPGSDDDVPTLIPDDEEALLPAGFNPSEAIAHLATVRILHDKIPKNLSPSRFLATMVEHVLEATPVTMHEEARERRDEPVA